VNLGLESQVASAEYPAISFERERAILAVDRRGPDERALFVGSATYRNRLRSSFVI